MKQLQRNGFSLIEVVFALVIITTLTMSLATLLRTSFDIREALGQNDEISHRISFALQRIVGDLQHAYIISDQDFARFGDPQKRKIKSLFELTVGTDADTLRFTTMNHQPLVKNAKESDTSFVIYKLEEGKDNKRTNLMRGETPRVPSDFNEEVKLKILAREIKALRIRPWRGDEWMRDSWDSSKRETNRLLPKMVQIEIEAYAVPAELSETSSRTLSTTEEPVVKYQTVVTIPTAMGLKDLRSGSSSIRWDKL